MDNRHVPCGKPLQDLFIDQYLKGYLRRSECDRRSEHEGIQHHSEHHHYAHSAAPPYSSGSAKPCYKQDQDQEHSTQNA